MKGDEVIVDGMRFMVAGEYSRCENCSAEFTIGNMDFKDGQGERIIAYKISFRPSFCPRCGIPEPKEIQALVSLDDDGEA